jgi:putative transposase
MVAGRRLGPSADLAARAGQARRWPRSRAFSCDHGQPKREDHGKRGVRGYDAGKKMNGRKRHILVDTLGFLLGVVVHAADIQDKSGGVLLLERFSNCFKRLQAIFADGAYQGPGIEAACKEHHNSRIEIVKRNEQHLFKVLPKRWIVERTLAWLGRNRRLSKDYEYYPETGEAFLKLAMIRLIAGRIA